MLTDHSIAKFRRLCLIIILQSAFLVFSSIKELFSRILQKHTFFVFGIVYTCGFPFSRAKKAMNHIDILIFVVWIRKLSFVDIG